LIIRHLTQTVTMKPLSFIRTLVLLSAFVLFYTACKKNAVKPAAKTAPVSYETISSKLSVTLYKSVTGQYGGVDVTKGIKSPFNVKTTGNKKIFSTNPLCGFTIDTGYTYATYSGYPAPQNPFDTTYTGSVSMLFKYTCSNGYVDGYKVDDSVSYRVRDYASFNDFSAIGQHYTVRALDQTYKLVSMDGLLNSSVYNSGLFNESGTSLVASYSLAGLKVSFVSGTADITEGIATFHMVYYPPHSFVLPPIQPTIYDGSIQFLGNHKAKLTINPGHVFLVDLTTGVVTPV